MLVGFFIVTAILRRESTLDIDYLKRLWYNTLKGGEHLKEENMKKKNDCLSVIVAVAILWLAFLAVLIWSVIGCLNKGDTESAAMIAGFIVVWFIGGPILLFVM